MARKKRTKQKPDESPGSPAVPHVPERLASPFAEALRDLKPAAKRPRNPKQPTASEPLPVRARRSRPESRAASGPSQHSYEDRVAYSQAYSGVAPLRSGSPRLGRRPEVSLPPNSDDASARRRLANLVADGLQFVVRREDGWVEGFREGAIPEALQDLHHGRARAEAEVDLHGLRVTEATRELTTFLRRARQQGKRVVRVVHGKGLHSDGGVGVLGDAVVAEIVTGSLGPNVLAFSTCATDRGGSGAVLLRLDVG